MKFLNIKKLHEGKFIDRYDAQYELEDGSIKNYELISRNRNLQRQDDLPAKNPDAVVIIATDESGERILISREFRMAVGEWVYNFPAGIIEPGEKIEDAAVRELSEETGLELYEMNDFIPLSYSAVGFSNESNVCIVGKARGEFKKSSSLEEEIVPGFFTKKEISEMLKTERFSVRCQTYLYLWSKGIEQGR